MRWILAQGMAALVAMMVVGAGAAQARSVALVIGNSAYRHAPRLDNPYNDANDVAAALTRLGFKVTRLYDADRDAMLEALEKFQAEAARSEIALVFYAGHGIGVDGRSWLVPVDAVLARQQAVALEAISLAQVLAAAGEASRLRLVVLDACRDDPFTRRMRKIHGSRRISRGLARIEPVGDTLVWYAAKDGSTASDGTGKRNSPFSAALLKHIERPGLEIGLLFREIAGEVRDATKGEQIPFSYGSLSRDRFFFRPAAVGAPADDVAAFAAAAALKAPAARAAALEAFIARYPGSLLRASAELALATARRAAAATAAASPAASPAATAPAPVSSGDARADWIKVRRSVDPAALASYRARWPKARFAKLAAARFARLVGATTDLDALGRLRARFPAESAVLTTRIAALLRAELDKAIAARTVAALEAFRRRRPGSPLDAEARAAIAALEKDLAAAQRELRRLGLFDGEPDGIWGEASTTALKKFEAARKLPVDGRVSAKDLAALKVVRVLPRFLADLEKFTECAACPEMVAIPAGSFLMGSPKTELKRYEYEGPQRRVVIKRFAIGMYEITFEQWDRCAAEGYCRSNPKPSDQGWGRGKRPVINVSWEDITGAGGFLDWMNSKVAGSPYRLPSEAEWEYAARAGTVGPFSFKGKISADKANYDADYSYAGSPKGVFRRKTLPVGSFAANPWGLYDVHGNVWEWVQDCWHGSYRGAPADGAAWMAADKGDCSHSILRGGSWGSIALGLRSALRHRNLRAIRNGGYGFRVARTIIPR